MSGNSTAPNSTRKSTVDRPAKPADDFPLQPHASGHWSKRVRGRLCYFGSWSQKVNGRLVPLPDGGNWKAALARYELEIDDLKAGRVRQANLSDPNGLRVGELCNCFLHAQRQRVEAKEPEITWQSFREYKEACDEVVAEFKSHRLVADLKPTDFQRLKARMTKRWGAARVGKFMALIRKVFKDAREDGHIENEVRFGSAFKVPDRKKAA